MNNFSSSRRPISVACAVLALLPLSAALRAEQKAALTVQASDSGVPQVRSVLRETAQDERVTAAQNETVELLFADGTSLTLAPGTSVLIEHYQYDAARRAGALRFKVDSGVVRVVGGALNNVAPIEVSLPGGTATLDNAIAYIDTSDGSSRITLVSGRSIQVSGAGTSAVLDKAATSVVLSAQSGPDSKTARLSASDAKQLTDRLNPGLASGVVPRFVSDSRIGSVSVVQDAEAIALADARGEFSTDEDETAKDIKLTPAPISPLPPGTPCSSSACTGGAPNFDLGNSIGTIAGRTTGQSATNQWRSAYQQGTANNPYNAPATDFLPVGGFRTTTARIFASPIGTPYSVTLSATAAPTTAGTEAALRYTCAAGTTCVAAPITNLYDVTSPSPLQGLFYKVYSSTGDSGPRTTLNLTYDGSDTSQSNVDSIVTAVPLFSRPGGELFSVTPPSETISWCTQSNVFCTVQEGGIDSLFTSQQDALDAAAEDAELYSFDRSNIPAIFGQSALNTLAEEVDPGLYIAKYQWSTEKNYTLNVLQAGFHILDEAADPDENSDPDDNSGLIIARNIDSFLAVEQISRLPGDTQRLFYATGSVTGALASGTAAQGATLDSFKLGSGLAPNTPGDPLGRAFLRPDTLLNVAPGSLLSSDLRVLNAPYAASISTPSRALQYDFALAGSGNEQTSTISVTLGTLSYSTDQHAAQLVARTVGSIARSGTVTYSGGVQSALFSTAAGGGNPHLTSGTGRAGYLVLENYDPISAPNGGLERTVESGPAGSTNYALLRFGQVVAGSSGTAPTRTSSTGLSGYVAGLAELKATATGNVTLVPLLSGNLQLQTDAAAGSVGASFSAAFGGTAATTVTLGGANRLSAFTGDKEFAAMTASVPNFGAGAITDATAPNAALISGAPLLTSTTQGWTSSLDSATRNRLASGTSTSYRHLQWGYFFGDVTTVSGAAAHSHLAGWIAGRPTPEGTPLPTVEADYAGHVAASILNGTRQYSAIGTYANHWSFANRSGTGSINLDGQNYNLVTRLEGLSRNGTEVTSTSTTKFEGVISSANQATTVGSLTGTFVAPGTVSTDPLTLRSAMMGQFSINQTLNGSAYSAIGTFGAERTGP